MYQARYFKSDGKKGSDVSLPERLFDGVVNEAVLHQSVKAYLANQRQGTSSTKGRSDVAGGSRKPWRQKGTGRARAGTTRASQWAGGGITFGPQPHSWRQKMPKRSRAIAHKSALNSRAEAGRIIVLESFGIESPKTSQLRNLLASLETQGKVLILTNGIQTGVYLSSRNLQGVHVLPFGEESPYDVLWAQTVIIEKAALDTVGAPDPADGRARRRPLDREALAEAAEEQNARRVARRTPASGQREAEVANAVVTNEKAAPAKKTKAKAPKTAPAKKPKAAPALPKIAELAAALSGIDSAADVQGMMSRDTRKTAIEHYETRLAQLSSDGQEEE